MLQLAKLNGKFVGDPNKGVEEANLFYIIPEKVSTNKIYAGLHWSKRNKLKDMFHTSMLQFKGLKMIKFPVKITYTFYWSGTPLDTTNQTYMIKMIEDGLVAVGVFPDDSPKYIHSTTSISEKAAKGSPADTVLINIRPVESS